MSFGNLIWVWPLLLFLFYYLRARLKIEGVGFVTVYILNFFTLYGVGSAIRLFPFHTSLDKETAIGLQYCTYGLLAFMVGSLIAPVIVSQMRVGARRKISSAHPEMPFIYLAIGVSAFLATPFLGSIGGLSVVLQTTTLQYMVGLCLLCWSGIREKRWGRLGWGLILTSMLPLITMLTQGFLGYGAAAVVVVLAFLMSLYPVRKTILVSAVVAYLALSFFVTYMRDRNEIRTAVWGGQSLSNRISSAGTLTDFEWFDTSNPLHLRRVDGRMNQSQFLGLAVERLSRTPDFAHGETMWTAVVALIPRAIWPEKPSVAGSGDLVSKYTGITFAQGTSVGIGHALEFYINFGTAGVILGFGGLGILVTFLDLTSRERLASGDQQGFALRFVLGLALMQVGGTLSEATASGIGGFCVVAFLNHYLLSDYRKKRADRSSPNPKMAEGFLGSPRTGISTDSAKILADCGHPPGESAIP
jgi:hypothetical protein